MSTSRSGNIDRRAGSGQAGQRRLHPSKLGRPRIARRDLRRAADHRHLQHVVGADAVQRAFPRACRARQARRVGSGRRAVRVPGDVARRDERPSDRDAVPQPREHGRRGIDPRQPDRRRRPALRLRQDHAVADHGRGELRPAGARRVGRADAERQVPRRGHRLGHRRVAVQRRGRGRRDEPQGVHAGRVLHVALVRARATSWARRRRWRRWSRRSGCRCRTTPPFPPSTRAASRRRTSPAAASSSWSSRTSACRRS